MTALSIPNPEDSVNNLASKGSFVLALGLMGLATVVLNSVQTI
jgi:hypothetical protein